MRIGHELVDVVDRRRGDLGPLEHGHVLGQRARRYEFPDRPLAFLGVSDALGVGAKTRVGDHVGAPDCTEQPLGHRLHRGGDADIAAVFGPEDVARRSRFRAAAGARPDLAGQLIDRRFGGDKREQRVEQRQVDDLAAAATPLDLPQRDHHRKGAVEAGDHIGERGRRQGRLAVGKAGARGIARHALDQRAEAGPVAIGAVLPPARDAHDDEGGIATVQDLGAKPHRLERARAEILDQHLRAGEQIAQQRAPARLFEVERHALLVARIDLPVDADAARLPGSQRIALVRILDLDDLGTEIGKLQAQHIAGNEARNIDDPYSVERTGGPGLEGFVRHLRHLPSAPLTIWRNHLIAARRRSKRSGASIRRRAGRGRPAAPGERPRQECDRGRRPARAAARRGAGAPGAPATRSADPCRHR